MTKPEWDAWLKKIIEQWVPSGPTPFDLWKPKPLVYGYGEPVFFEDDKITYKVPPQDVCEYKVTGEYGIGNPGQHAFLSEAERNFFYGMRALLWRGDTRWEQEDAAGVN